jgi:hypothetical protein
MPEYETIYRDVGIRALLLPFIRGEYEGHLDLVCLEEFAIYGGANRADVAALNGCSHGYEIKSDRDTLERLPSQVEAYSAIFDQATLVTTARHLQQARAMIPQWWGIIEATSLTGGGSRLERLRESGANPAPHAESIAYLLWRPEALRLLTSLGLDSGVRSKPMECLVTRLANEIPVERLSALVREVLRARGDWRSAARLKQYDGRFQQPSSQSSYQRTPYGRIYR